MLVSSFLSQLIAAMLLQREVAGELSCTVSMAALSIAVLRSHGGCLGTTAHASWQCLVAVLCGVLLSVTAGR